MLLLRILFLCFIVCFFFFKQKTAYEMRISDWSSDVCSSDLSSAPNRRGGGVAVPAPQHSAARRRRPCRAGQPSHHGDSRSEERRVGNECVSTWRSRWSQSH